MRWNLYKRPSPFFERKIGYAIFSLVFLITLSSPSLLMASSPGMKTTIPWHNPSQFLEYHSCGCADSCWVAELRQKTTRRLIIRLRCDCHKVLYGFGKGKTETVLSEDGNAFEGEGKMDKIAEQIKKLLKEHK